MVFLDMLNEKRFENYLLFPIFATNIFLLWYNLMCFFKSHFSRNLPSQISKAVCYGILSYASSSRLRKILSRKMIQLRNLCSPSSPMSPWSWRSPWSIMCLLWQQRSAPLCIIAGQSYDIKVWLPQLRARSGNFVFAWIIRGDLLCLWLPFFIDFLMLMEYVNEIFFVN